MNTERFKIYDEKRNEIGIASREEVHRLGYWHEAFHCWFVSKEEKDYIYLQLRSELKKDYPNLLDITAAGHLLYNETVLDGVREIREELGLEVSINELELLGVLDYCVFKEDFIDKEIAHIFLYRCNKKIEDFTLQVEEVSGMFKAGFEDFKSLMFGDIDQISVHGFILDSNGNKVVTTEVVNRCQFVQHEESYYRNVINFIDDKIRS